MLLEHALHVAARCPDITHCPQFGGVSAEKFPQASQFGLLEKRDVFARENHRLPRAVAKLAVQPFQCFANLWLQLLTAESEFAVHVLGFGLGAKCGDDTGAGVRLAQVGIVKCRIPEPVVQRILDRGTAGLVHAEMEHASAHCRALHSRRLIRRRRRSRPRRGRRPAPGCARRFLPGTARRPRG